MTGRLRRAVVVVGLALAFVALAPGVMTAQTGVDSGGENVTGTGSGGETVSALAREAKAATAELQRASARADRRLVHVGSGAVFGLGIGLVVGSVVSFQVWRARVR